MMKFIKNSIKHYLKQISESSFLTPSCMIPIRK